MYNSRNVPQYDLEVSAWLMGSVNSGEWGDDLPPHPSPSDGHGKLVHDRLWGGWGCRVQMGLRIGPEEAHGFCSMAAARTRGKWGGEKCGQDWGQGCMIGVLDGPQLAWVNVCMGNEDGLSGCFCMSCAWDISKSAFDHFAWMLLSSACLQCKTLNHTADFSTVLWLTFVKEQPTPTQMMNLVIRSGVTPFSKSCWGVMSLWGPLVSYSHWTEDQRHQSSQLLKWSWLLSEGAPPIVDFSSGVQCKAHVPVARWVCVHTRERERGVLARCADNEQQTSDWHGWYWVKTHRAARMQCTRNVSIERVQWHLTLVTNCLSTHILPSFCAWQCDHMFSCLT